MGLAPFMIEWARCACIKHKCRQNATNGRQCDCRCVIKYALGPFVTVPPPPFFYFFIAGVVGVVYRMGMYKEMTEADIDKLPGTAFQHDVWRALVRIPRGQVRTYSDVAKMAGHPNAVRAVANAVGANPVPPIIPCHRVIRIDGKLGGYSGPGGIETKRKLLASEGVYIK